jgi:tRNA A37 threonylcarbamoyladenosine modification protein TsaB
MNKTLQLVSSLEAIKDWLREKTHEREVAMLLQANNIHNYTQVYIISQRDKTENIVT